MSGPTHFIEFSSLWIPDYKQDKKTQSDLTVALKDTYICTVTVQRQL